MKWYCKEGIAWMALFFHRSQFGIFFLRIAGCSAMRQIPRGSTKSDKSQLTLVPVLGGAI
jgi:hypothetical protein